MEVSGGVAVLTGASRGIGVTVADALAAAGMRLVLAARSAVELETQARELRGRGVEAIAAPVDITEAAGREALVTAAMSAFGGIDVLVNNAGLDMAAAYHEADPQAIEALLQVNLVAPLLLTRRVLPLMLAQRRGHIVNVASLAGKFAPAYHEAYNTSKAGLIHFTWSLRASYRGTGVSASVICPGFIREAGMFHDMQTASGVPTPPLLGTSAVEDVARAVVRAIREDRGEIDVSARPVLPLVLLKTLAPGLAEWLQPRVGGNVFRAIAERAGQRG